MSSVTSNFTADNTITNTESSFSMVNTKLVLCTRIKEMAPGDVNRHIDRGSTTTDARLHTLRSTIGEQTFAKLDQETKTELTSYIAETAAARYARITELTREARGTSQSSGCDNIGDMLGDSMVMSSCYDDAFPHFIYEDEARQPLASDVGKWQKACISHDSGPPPPACHHPVQRYTRCRGSFSSALSEYHPASTYDKYWASSTSANG